MLILPVRRSFTGWLAPRWPNFSLKVFAPSAWEMIWCPKQMPNMGTFPIRAATSRWMSVSVAGSPGPLERKTPSGFMPSTSSAVVWAGTTVTRKPFSLSWRRMLYLMPKSKATMSYSVGGSTPSVTSASTSSGVMGWEPILSTMLQPSMEGAFLAASTASSGVSSVVRQARMAPAERRCLAILRVSTPSMPITPCFSSHGPRASVARQLEGTFASSATTKPLTCALPDS